MSKWVVVTGAAGGIGQECARRFAADGYSQLLIDIPGVSLVDTVAAARDGAGEQEVSVLTLESTLAGFDACVDALTGIDGPIYALVHLAGPDGAGPGPGGRSCGLGPRHRQQPDERL